MNRTTREATDAAVLLYDGTCGFCNGTVQLILRHDRRGTLRFATLRGAYGQAVFARHPELREADSIAWVDGWPAAGNERVLLRSDAALRVAEYLAGAWKALLVFRLLPRPIRDFGYDLFARYRYRLFGEHNHCLLPLQEWRPRFIDVLSGGNPPGHDR